MGRGHVSGDPGPEICSWGSSVTSPSFSLPSTPSDPVLHALGPLHCRAGEGRWPGWWLTPTPPPKPRRFELRYFSCNKREDGAGGNGLQPGAGRGGNISFENDPREGGIRPMRFNLSALCVVLRSETCLSIHLGQLRDRIICPHLPCRPLCGHPLPALPLADWAPFPGAGPKDWVSGRQAALEGGDGDAGTALSSQAWRRLCSPLPSILGSESLPQ